VPISQSANGEIGNDLLATILEGFGEAFYAVGSDWRVTIFNRDAADHFGRRAEEVLGQVLWDAFPGALETDLGRLFCQAMTERRLVTSETRSVVTPGRWLEFRLFPLGGGLGVRFRDVTDRKHAEQALRESEARFRHMADSAPAFIWMTDERGRLSFVNMHFGHVFQVGPEEILNGTWRKVIHPDDLSRFVSDFASAFHAREPFGTEVRIVDGGGRQRWLRCESVVRLDDAHRFLGYTGCAVEITTTKEAAQRQALLINELNHRVKNTLATVQSIAASTLRSAVSTESARGAFEERLIALSRAHDLLTRENWEGASVRAIVEQVLHPFGGGARPRLHVRGSDLRVSARQTIALAMALQELATNAVKYGALSNETGEVTFQWCLDDEVLRARWEEAGGPHVRAPNNRGFGTRLLERGLAHDLAGEVKLDFLPCGLVCTIAASVDVQSEQLRLSTELRASS
jgi:PAS domain S-box-containing protein